MGRREQDEPRRCRSSKGKTEKELRKQFEPRRYEEHKEENSVKTMEGKKVRFTTYPSLGDHNRLKKRLVAPWNMHFGIADKLTQISWHRVQIPQLIWITELTNRLGPNEDEGLQVSKAWVESQQHSFMVDVNLSRSCSGLNTRKMAEEAGCSDFYKHYGPGFSHTVHSTWNHIERYDLQSYTNPIHSPHRIPTANSPNNVVFFFELAAGFLAETFALIDEKLDFEVDASFTYEAILGGVDNGEVS